MSLSFESALLAPTVVVLPGGAYQTDLIKKIQAHGFRTICADQSAACPGRMVADDFVAVGLDERERLIEAIREYEPTAVLTDQTDSGVKTVAWLCEQLGLPGIGAACSELFTNKLRMRQFSREHGFATPDFRLCTTLGESIQAANEIGLPVVMKPLSNQSSRGVVKVERLEVLEHAIASSRRYWNSDSCVVEQYIEGTEFTVEGFKTPRGHHTLAISEKRHYESCPMVANSLKYLPHNPQFDYDELRRMNDAWVNASGLPFGITHAEYICRDGQFFLVEIAARGGGTRIASDIVPWVSGVDPQLLLLEYATKRKQPTVTPLAASRCALLEFFNFQPGIVKRINGLDQARALPGVLDIRLAFTAGQSILQVQDDTTRPGYFILTTETETELEGLRQDVLQRVEVEYE